MLKVFAFFLEQDIGSEDMLVVNAIKYFGVTVRAGVKINVDLDVVKRKSVTLF